MNEVKKSPEPLMKTKFEFFILGKSIGSFNSRAEMLKSLKLSQSDEIFAYHSHYITFIEK
jgi:hypothetical protein